MTMAKQTAGGTRRPPAPDYLRVSITDSCNYRCRYCIPLGCHGGIRREDLLSDQEIVRFTEAAADLGVSRVRVTGGEPLAREGVTELVASMVRVPGIEDIAMTTNGSLLAEYATGLAQAGLARVNISVDSLDDGRHRSVTGGAPVGPAIKGIEAALAAGLAPVKVNTVIMKGLEQELDEFIELVRDYPLHVRFIELMPINGATGDPLFMPLARLRDEIAGRVTLTPAMAPIGAGPARYRSFEGAKGSLGFISLRDHFCQRCNRLRLTADGRLRECLFSEHETDIRPLLHGDPDLLDQAIMASAARKSYDWRLSRRAAGNGTRGPLRSMAQIGG